MKWISTHDPIGPLAKLDDGANDIYIQTYQQPRRCLLNLLLGLDDGKWFLSKNQAPDKAEDSGKIDPSYGC